MSSNSIYNHTAFIGIGSNKDNPIEQVKQSIFNIANLKKNTVIILKTSGLYKTKPYGYENQDDFINLVIKIKTNLDGFELLEYLQSIEQKQHRVRTIHWGPRTIDLDILAFNDETINTNNLKVPHPDLKKRDFVIKPWFEIEPGWILPDGCCIKDIYNNHHNQH